jgi:glycerol-3-phosphate O-acyltransferase / dihydroxyacetone phosphate acyltransferase
MLYRIVKPFATLALKTNFRRIYFSNAQVIPKNKPVILAVNHPTAFLEPCLLACLLPEPLYFLVRGNMFVRPFSKWALNALHMIPIYRVSDGGFRNLRQNYTTFDICYDKLSENETIMILSEGNTILEKRLRPIQKGTARVAFAALEKDGNIDLKIVPVGVNYTYADRFRSHVMFEFGEPISIQNYKESFKNHPNKAIRSLTNDLESRLKKHVIIIEKKEDEDLSEKLFLLNHNNHDEPNFPVVSRHNKRLKGEKYIADTINKMPENEKTDLEKKIDNYSYELRKNNLDDWAVAQSAVDKSKGNLIIILGFLPFILGYLGNYPPILIANLVAAKYVKYIEFKASVKIAVAIGAIPLYYFFLGIISILTGNFMFLFLIFLLPILGYYSLIYREYFNKWKSLRNLKRVDSEKLNRLKTMRQNILET